MSKVLVTIQCIAYNHGRYIRDCLDGLLKQKTTFPYEILIHDDASTDNTAEIIREYAENYPNLIRAVCQEENQYSKGVDIYASILDPMTQGKYVALCEGDDYWTDENKLQKQFDFMEAHQDCSMCVHKVTMVNGTTGEFIDYMPNTSLGFEVMDTFGFLNLLKKVDWLFHTSSYFARWETHQEFDRDPPVFYQVAACGDTPFLLWAALQGKIGYIDEVMSCYRFEAVGSWTSARKDPGSEASKRAAIGRYNMYQEYNVYTQYQYHEILETILKEQAKVLYYTAAVHRWDDIDFDNHFPLGKYEKMLIRFFVRLRNLKHRLLK